MSLHTIRSRSIPSFIPGRRVFQVTPNGRQFESRTFSDSPRFYISKQVLRERITHITLVQITIGEVRILARITRLLELQWHDGNGSVFRKSAWSTSLPER
jgi:hypothetical protein